MAGHVKEIWKSILGYEGRYQVSNNGRVKSLLRGQKILRPWKTKYGYLQVALCKSSSKQKAFSVHRLVLAAFSGPCPRGLEASHKNGIRTDARACNLEWLTRKENHAMKYVHGTQQTGSRQACAKLHESDIPAIRTMLSDGVGHRVIAKKFDVSKSAITLINSGRTWSHV